MANIETRKSQDGSVAYRVKVRRKGTATQTKTFSRLTDAKKWSTQVDGAVLEGRHFPSAAAKRHTVGDAIKRYRGEVLCDKPKNARNTKGHLDWWDKRIGKLALAEAKPLVIIQCRDELHAGSYKSGKTTKRRSGATVIRYMAALSHVMTIAMKEWQWIDDNPFRKVSKPRAASGRARFLSETERTALLAACRASSSKSLLPIVVLAISTGMRLNEIQTLRWCQLDLTRGWLILDETKNGDRRGVKVAGYARDLLIERRAQSDAIAIYVFPGIDAAKPIEIKKAWGTAIRKAEITDFRFHDLRHTAASYLAMNGASPMEIASVLGHRTLQMVKRYAHIANEHTAKVVTSMNAKIFEGENHATNSY